MAGAAVQVYKIQDLPLVVESLYGSADKEVCDRFTAMIKGFENRYGKAPEFIGRSPGRVNLIGEHIDYMGYAVLPMAIRQDTIVAIGRADDGRVHVANLRAGFSEEDFGTIPDELVARTDHSWVNYVMASFKGVCGYVPAEKCQQITTGLNMMVEGQVPQGSGLSSSAALVCSAALALLGMLGVTVPQAEVAQFTAECEKFVGTESGGMDQAISIMGELGLAKLVHFNPIRTEDVPLPEGAIFVIANSLTESAKAVSADRQYNMRVVECRLATALLGLKLGLSSEEAVSRRTLREVEDLVRAAQGPTLGGPKGSVTGAELEVVRKLLDQEVYMQPQLEQLLGLKLEDMFAGNASQLRCVGVARDFGFKLRDRALHVFSEAARVPEFKAACDSNAPADQKLLELARLMDLSHASCRDLYECSCEELDTLVTVSKAAGALGSRLTGAGWGGCTVSLVRQEDVEGFIAKVKQEYYVAGVNDKKLSERLFERDGEDGWRPIIGWQNVIFASPPGSGGAILDLR
ncbi:N-acetylgalactosamine kinase [Coccomyxa sp. Obi]|nr:N-acetylgalactosamine kinase [Coccomyxa sp. Obi]